MDPTVTWDSQGNSYVAGSLTIFVGVGLDTRSSSRSPTRASAARSSTRRTRTGGFQEYRSLPLGVASNVNDPNVSLDKPMIVADANPTSPKRDNVYLTWTRYGPEIEDSGDGPQGVRAISPIFFSQSADGGATWTPPIEISGRNFDLCPTVECYHDQGSDTVVGPDGSLYVAFANRDSTERSPSSSSS